MAGPVFHRNGDGTWSSPSDIGNGDGTWTADVTDNGDGTWSVAATPTTYWPSPPVFTPDDLLSLPRVSGYRVELLSNDETSLGALSGVQPGGYVKQVSTAAVHGSGEIQLTDTGQDVDWLNTRVRPVLTMIDPADPDNTYDHPLGIFLPALPEEAWTDTGRSWNVELTDKLGILDTDIPKNDDGSPYTYSVAAGDNVLALVMDLIRSAGESVPAILPSGETVGTARTWDIGTTKLKICNDLLSSAGYFSLWCDNAGQYRVTEYVSPAMRAPICAGRFTDGEPSVLTPDYTITKDVYGVPNYYPVTASGTDVDDPLVSFAVNLNPNSPFSYPSRGRWITAPTASVEATSQGALDSRAQMLLSQATAVTASIPVKHLYLPKLAMNQAVQFSMGSDRGGYNMLMYVTSTQTPLDPNGLCQTNLHEAVI